MFFFRLTARCRADDIVNCIAIDEGGPFCSAESGDKKF